MYRKKVIQDALDAAEFDDKDSSTHTYSGTLEINDLVFYLRESSEDGPKSFEEYFVIIISYGTTVIASKVLSPDKKGEIMSNRSFKFTGLCTDFELDVTVYSIKVKESDKMNCGDLKMHKKGAQCPSTRNFFHLKDHKSPRRNSTTFDHASITSSVFDLWGMYKLRCSDLTKTDFRMHKVPLMSSLEDRFKANLVAQVELHNRTCGFLTVAFGKWFLLLSVSSL